MRRSLKDTSVRFCWLVAVFARLTICDPFAAAASDDVGTKICAGCHPSIYRSYSRTGMSQSSGKVGDGSFRESLAHAQFSDPALGIDFLISRSGGGYRMEFSRSSSGVSGERPLAWFIGSGRVARSYISPVDGF